MRNKIWIFSAMMILSLALAGCSAGQGAGFEGATADGVFNEDAAGSDMSFGVTVEKRGDPVGIYFESMLTQGSLQLQLEDAQGQVVWSKPAAVGETKIQETLTNLEPGEYRLGWVWDGALKGSFSFAWQPGGMALPPVTGWVFLPGVGMIAVSLGFIIYALKKKLGWRYLLLGALAWMVTVALKLAFAAGLNATIYNALHQALEASLADPVFYVYVGLLTGIFEVALTYLALRYTRLGKVDWQQALSFGIGFGAVEALLLGLSPLALAVTLVAAPDSLPMSTRLNLGSLNNPLYGLAPSWERFFTIWIHIFCNVLLFLAVAKRQPKWFWLSFAYKSLLDVAAAYGQLTGLETLGKIWAIEAYVGVMGVIAWWGVTRVKKAYPQDETALEER